MNRRQRRAASKSAEPDTEKKQYMQTCEAMHTALVDWLRAHPGGVPRFAMPPREVGVVGCIDDVVDIIAKDDAARQLVGILCDIGVKIRPHGQPTILMLRVVLDTIGLPYEVAPMEEFAAKFPLVPIGSPMFGSRKTS